MENERKRSAWGGPDPRRGPRPRPGYKLSPVFTPSDSCALSCHLMAHETVVGIFDTWQTLLLPDHPESSRSVPECTATAETLMEGRLRDLLLDIEDRIHQGTLGTLKVQTSGRPWAPSGP